MRPGTPPRIVLPLQAVKRKVTGRWSVEDAVGGAVCFLGFEGEEWAHRFAAAKEMQTSLETIVARLIAGEPVGLDLIAGAREAVAKSYGRPVDFPDLERAR